MFPVNRNEDQTENLACFFFSGIGSESRAFYSATKVLINSADTKDFWTMPISSSYHMSYANSTFRWQKLWTDIILKLTLLFQKESILLLKVARKEAKPQSCHENFLLISPSPKHILNLQALFISYHGLIRPI